MAIINYTELSSLSLSSLHSSFNQVSSQVDALNATILDLDQAPLFVDGDSATNTQATGTWGPYILLITGSGFLGNSPVFKTISLTDFITNSKIVLNGNFTGSGGTLSNIAVTEGNSVIKYTGTFRLNADLDFTSAVVKTVSIVNDGYSISLAGSLTMNLDTDEISDGTVNSFKVTDPAGHTLSLSGIELDYDLFYSLIDSATYSDFTTLLTTVNAGNDTIVSGIGDDTLMGGAGNDNLTSGAGDDHLDGGAGNDLLNGGAGNDTYIVDSILDKITESLTLTQGGGNDTVESSVTYTLGTNLDHLTLTGHANINGRGNAFNNVITGNDGDNLLDGATGSDTLIGGQGNDSYLADLIVTKAGTSTSVNTSQFVDTITEQAGEGSDTLNLRGSANLASAAVFSLTGTLANFENINASATGSTKINLTGNDEANYLTGNAAINTLIGGMGDDTLDGGLGNDVLDGGEGNDTYIINSLSDVITDVSGNDAVQAAFTLSLENPIFNNSIENATLTGAANLNVTGNTADNKLTGNDGINILDGKAGADTMDGGKGNDTYSVDDEHDIVSESLTSAQKGGIDLVRSSVSFTLGTNIENLTLTDGSATGGLANINGTGNDLNNTIIGNAGNNRIDGGAGNDLLNGGAGNDKLNGGIGTDTLTGGDGADQFTFNAALNSDVDTITDFSHDLDKLVLDAYIFQGLGGAGSESFAAGAGLKTAADSNIHLIYDTSSGTLYYDEDGAGGNSAIAFAKFTLKPAGFNFSDVIIINSSDTVYSSVSYVMNPFDYRLTLTGSNPINGTGNDLDNQITGNSASNFLIGNDGDDTLIGREGNDTIIGGEGLDSLDGGEGEDIYIYTDSNDYEGAEITDSGIIGNDEIRFASSINGQTLTLHAQDTGFEDVIIGTGTGAYADISGTTNLNIDASAILISIGMLGNAGNNVLIGSAQDDFILGYFGKDTLIGGSGTDHIDGGEGSDIYIIYAPSDHSDYEIVDNGFTGTDEIRFTSTVAGQTLTLFSQDAGIESVVIATGTGAAGNSSATTSLNVNASALQRGITLTGNEGNNILTATSSSDLIIGGGGDDELVGNSGDDTLNGGNGLDVLNGGIGSDIYLINASSEHISAEISDTGITGSDEVRFTATVGSQTLTLFAQDSGIETVVIGTGINSIANTSGTSNLNVNASAILNGLIITGNNGNNAITGTIQSDFISTGAGDDTVIGSGGNDTIIGDSGIDSIDGGEASDLYVINAASEHANAEFHDSGSSGQDELRFASTIAGDTLNLFANDFGLEKIVMGTGTGSVADNSSNIALHLNASAVTTALTILGNAGSNAITGTSGDDTLIGGAGNDSLRGGEGSDLYVLNVSTEHVVAEINDAGLNGIDELRFAATSVSYSELTLFAGDIGIEKVIIGTGTDTVADTSAAISLQVNAAAVLNALTIVGNDGGNTITGTSFNDSIIGNGGDDNLLGGGGNDTLLGGTGRDVLWSGAGIDVMDGGEDNDTYYVNAASDHTQAEFADTGTSKDEVRFISNVSGDTLRLYAGDTGIEIVSIGLQTYDTGTIALNIDASKALNGLTLIGNYGDNFILGSTQDDIMSGVYGNDTLYGGSGNDSIYGGSGNDFIYGGAGNDVLDGSAGDDVYLIDSPSEYTISEILDSGFSDADVDEIRFISTTANSTLVLQQGTYGIESIVIGTGVNPTANTSGTTALNVDASDSSWSLLIKGNAGINNIKGSVASDTITGGLGTDSLDGGDAGDIYIVGSNAEHTSAEFRDTGLKGTDEVRYSSLSAGTLTLFAQDLGIEAVQIGTGTQSIADISGNAAININASAVLNGLTISGNSGTNMLTGTAFGDTIQGNAGNDILIGGVGVDTLDGGDGSDLYIISSGAEHSAAEISDFSYSTNDIDEVRFTSTQASDTLTIFAGDLNIERVVIGTGSSTVADSSGTTALNIDASDYLSTFNLPEYNYTAGLEIIGNNGNNLLKGSSSRDLINGEDGNDTIYGGEINLSSPQQKDRGIDTIIGGAGIDILDGGNGNDIYVINSISEHTSAEIKDTGLTDDYGYYYIDEIRFASTIANEKFILYAAETGVESIVIGTGTDLHAKTAGTTNLDVDASAAVNKLSIVGNNGINQIVGTDYADTIAGGGGIDILTGGLGNDVYDISSSSDHLAAEITDSSGYNYVRFSSHTAGETLILFAEDTGISSISLGYGNVTDQYTNFVALNVNASALQYGVSIEGNSGDNNIIGTSFNDSINAGLGTNTVNAGAGNDFLYGGYGIDIFYGGSGNDYITGGYFGNDQLFGEDGNDSIIGSYNNDFIDGGTGDDTLSGGDNGNNTIDGGEGNDIISSGVGNDLINGGMGDDTIYGGVDSDILTGGEGADIFVFNAVYQSSNTVRDLATITDFESTVDRLQLDHNRFTQLGIGNLTANNFISNSSGTAGDASDQIIYNTTTGALYYDIDGSGSAVAVEFANLTGHPLLTASDIFIT